MRQQLLQKLAETRRDTMNLAIVSSYWPPETGHVNSPWSRPGRNLVEVPEDKTAMKLVMIREWLRWCHIDGEDAEIPDPDDFDLHTDGVFDKVVAGWSLGPKDNKSKRIRISFVVGQRKLGD